MRCTRPPPHSRALRSAGTGRGTGRRASVVSGAPPRGAGRSGVDDQHRAQVERVVLAGSGRVMCSGRAGSVHGVIPFHRDIYPGRHARWRAGPVAGSWSCCCHLGPHALDGASLMGHFCICVITHSVHFVFGLCQVWVLMYSHVLSANATTGCQGPGAVRDRPQHGPGSLAGSPFERVPAGPGTQGLDQQQAAPALVVIVGALAAGSTRVIIADEDGRLAPAEGEPTGSRGSRLGRSPAR